jgi:hypothetical protein
MNQQLSFKKYNKSCVNILNHNLVNICKHRFWNTKNETINDEMKYIYIVGLETLSIWCDFHKHQYSYIYTYLRPYSSGDVFVPSSCFLWFFLYINNTNKAKLHKIIFYLHIHTCQPINLHRHRRLDWHMIDNIITTYYVWTTVTWLITTSPKSINANGWPAPNIGHWRDDFFQVKESVIF